MRLNRKALARERNAFPDARPGAYLAKDRQPEPGGTASVPAPNSPRSPRRRAMAERSGGVKLLPALLPIGATRLSMMGYKVQEQRPRIFFGSSAPPLVEKASRKRLDAGSSVRRRISRARKHVPTQPTTPPRQISTDTPRRQPRVVSNCLTESRDVRADRPAAIQSEYGNHRYDAAA